MSYSTPADFFMAQKSAKNYIAFVVIETAQGNHVFHRGGLLSANLPAQPIIHMSQRLESVSDMPETLISNDTDLFGSYTQTEMSDCEVTLSDSDNYFSMYFKDHTFLDATLTVKCGYSSLAYADLLTVFSGKIVTETLTGPELRLQGVAE